jgi:hypothetical protein
MSRHDNERRAGRAEGERRKDASLDTLGARRERYVIAGRRALVKAMVANGTATADDVRDQVELPEGIDPKCFGSVPGPLARAGIAERVGFVTTTRPSAHARPISVWKIANFSKAEQWLREHPEPDSERRVGQQTLWPESCDPNKKTDPAAVTTESVSNNSQHKEF